MDRGAWQVTVQRVLIGTGIWNLTTFLYQALILNYVNVNKLVKAMVFPDTRVIKLVCFSPVNLLSV